MSFPVHTIFQFVQTQPIPEKYRCKACGEKWAQGKTGLCRSCARPGVAALIEAFFRSRDPFVVQAGFTVGVFVSQAGKLLASVPVATAPDVDWLDECQAMHGGRCNGRMGHHNQTLIDEHKAEQATKGRAS